MHDLCIENDRVIAQRISVRAGLKPVSLILTVGYKPTVTFVEAVAMYCDPTIESVLRKAACGDFSQPRSGCVTGYNGIRS